MLVVKANVDNITVIHFSGDPRGTSSFSSSSSASSSKISSASSSSSSTPIAKVREDIFQWDEDKQIIDIDKLELLTYLESDKIDPKSAKDAIDCARKMICKDQQPVYDVITCNCEHFVNWVLTGNSFSTQADKIFSIVRGMVVGACVASIVSEDKNTVVLGAVAGAAIALGNME